MSLVPEAAFAGENLVCHRGERRVFEGLSFTLAPGQALILSGPNGSGKSSLLRLCAGFLTTEAGRLMRDGQDVALDPEGHRSTLHYAGHANALKAVMTVSENIGFWASLYGGEAHIEEALEVFDLSDLADLPARYLSSGQQHRTALARLVAVPQPLWLLDEPAVGLDAAAVAALARLIAAHRLAGGMVMVSTHTDLGLEAAGQLRLQDFTPKRRYADEVTF
jgi:heme exporter protein A